MNDFEKSLADLDLLLFEKIGSQSTDDDKQSLLAIQLAVGQLRPGYNYLEIGSYIGGSIQPHLLDGRCRRIYSIDKRPRSQPDARGYDWVYQNNSTARMMKLLSAVGPTDKMTTIDGDTRSLDPALVADKIDLCFIDGEHTDGTVFSDFTFCLKTLATSGVIIFHDAQITYNGIAACVRHLEDRSIGFRAYPLPTYTFVIEIGDLPIHKHPRITERLLLGHNSYISSLQYNDNYRRFATGFPFGFLRRTLIRMRGTNVSE